MKFRYLNDSLFRGGILLLLLNGLVLKRLSDAAFLHHYFNDCLLIPCALPILLLLQRMLRLREHDQAPTAAEIGGHLVLWAVLFEVAGPHLMAHAVGDWRDVVCYWVGGMVAWCHWNRHVVFPGVDSQLPMNFDPVARWYSAIELFTAGSLIQQTRVAHLSVLKDRRRILILGEGNGRFVEALLMVNPDAQIVVVESSRKMIHLAQRRLAQAELPLDKIHFIHTDVCDWQPKAGIYDAIVSHFFLDCFSPSELTGIVPNIAAAGTEGCVWLQSDFAVPAGGFKRIRAELILWTMYRFFRASTQLSASALSDPSERLSANGFELDARETRSWGLLNCDVWKKSTVVAVRTT